MNRADELTENLVESKIAQTTASLKITKIQLFKKKPAEKCIFLLQIGKGLQLSCISSSPMTWDYDLI